MALPPILVELKASSAEFTAKMGEARGEVAKLGTESAGHMQKFSAVGKAALLGVAGVATAVGGASLELADKFEQAQTRLEGAITNVGGNFETLKPHIDAVNTQMGKFGFTSTETESALAGLTTATKNPTQALNMMSLAADIARGRNMSLQQSTDLLTKVETGHVSLLGRLGIATKDAAGNTITQQQAVQRLTQLYGGDAQRSAETFAGKTQALKAQAENLGTQFGMVLVPILGRLMSITESVVGWFEKHRTAAEALGAIVGGVLVIAIASYVAGVVAAQAASVTAFASMVASSASWVAEQVAGFASAAAAALASFASMAAEAATWAAAMLAAGAEALLPFAPIIAIVAALGIAAYELYQHWDTVWSGIKAAVSAAWSLLKTVFDAIVSVGLMPIRAYIDLLRGEWEIAWTAIRAVLSAAWSAMKAVFDTIRSAGIDVLRAAVAGMSAVWSSVWGAIQSIVSGAWSGIRAVFSAIRTVGLDVLKGDVRSLQGVWSAAWNAIRTVVSDVWNFISGIFNEIKRGVSDVIGALGSIASHIPGASLLSHIPGLASGTDYASGGLTLVGERGPELVNMPRGAQVTTAARTADILTPTDNSEVVSKLDELIAAVHGMPREHLRLARAV